MPNMSLKKVPMPEQEPNVRNHNFQEVSLGYTKEMAMEEAARCLNCKHKPCVGGCPVNIRIPEFIAKVAEGDFQAAYDIISDTNALPSVSGRVCPQESQCEARCVRAIKGEPVAIGRLERFVADWYRENVNAMPQKPQTNGIKVAVVGSGPASLTCASDLAKHGYEVTIFEAFHTAGGVLVYGIPEFRLPKAIVQNEVDKLTALGVDLETDMVIGKTFDIDEMFEEGYEAVFIGSGAGLPMFMGIEGETLAGVYSANEYLTRINLMKAYREGYDTPLKISGSAAIIGGGNVAMDAARCAKRQGGGHRVHAPHQPGEGAGRRHRPGGRPGVREDAPHGPRRERTTRPQGGGGLQLHPGGGHRGHEPGHQPQPPDPLHHPRPGDQPEGLPPGGRGDHGHQPPRRLCRRRRRHRRGHRHPGYGRRQEGRRVHAPVPSGEAQQVNRQAEEGRPDGVALLILERRGHLPAPHAYGFFTWCRRYGHRRRPSRGRCSHGR